jgi:hydrogenase small subunit
MSEKDKTLYQEIRDKGYSRREFMKFCGMMGALLGLHSTGVA